MNSTVTAIVPYDTSYVSDAFSDQDGKDGKAIQQGQQLIMKTFDITVRVAPPLSTDWRKFLYEKLDEAFPSPLDDEEKYKLFKLFDLDQQDQHVITTPRNVISYINEVSSIWNQWGDKVKVSHIALYVLQTHNIKDNPEIIKTGVIDNQRQVHVLEGEDWPRSLAALHFNVDPAHAYQVLLDQDIRRIAIGTDEDAFVELSNINGFAEVFPDVIAKWGERWARDGAEYLSNLCKNMADERILGQYFQEVWNHIAEVLAFLEDCDTTRPGIYQGLTPLIKNLGIGKAYKSAALLVEWYSSHIPDAEDQRTVEAGIQWYEFFSSIYSAVLVAEGQESADKFIRHTTCPKGPNISLGVCSSCTESDLIDFDKLRRTEPKSSLQTASMELVSSDLALLTKVIRKKVWFADAKYYEEVTNLLCNRIHGEKLDKESRSKISELLCRIRIELETGGNIKARIAQQVNDGSIVWHALQAHKEGGLQSAGRLVWCIVDCTPGDFVPSISGNHPHFGDLNPIYKEYENTLSNITEDEPLTGELARLASLSEEFGTWLGYAIDKNKPEFFKIVFRRIVKQGDYRSLPLVEVVSQYPQFEPILGEELSKVFLAKLTSYATHFETTFSGEECLKIPPRLLETIANNGTEGLNDLATLVDEYFDTFDTESWTELFSCDNNVALDLLFIRIIYGEYQPPLAPFQEALMEHTMEVLDGNAEVVEPYTDRWPLLFNGIPANTQQGFSRDVLVNLKGITTTPKSVEHFLKTNSDLASQLPLEDQPDIALDHFVKQLVSSGSEVAMQFIRDHAEQVRKCAGAASSEILGRLQEALESLRDTGDDSASKALEVADLLEVKLAIKTEKPEEPEADS